MKKILLFAIAIISLGQTLAQNNVTVFSEDGLPFYLILNGVRQNENPQTNIRLEGLSQEMFTAKVIFNDQAIPEIDKKWFAVANDECRPCDVTYKIKTNKKGEVVLKVFAFNQLQTAPPPPQNVTVVQYNTTPMPPVVYGTSVQVTETTTTTHGHSGSTGESVDMNINVGGFNMGIDVDINDGGFHDGHSHTSTTTTTSTTTYNNTPTHVVVEEVNYCQMNDTDFQSLRNSMKQKSFDDDKLVIAKQAASSNCMTSSQIKQIMQDLEWEDARLDFAKYAYPYCYDQNNYYQVNDAFEWSDSIDELNDAIR